MNRPASIHGAMRPLLPFVLLSIVFLAVAGQAWSQCSITSGGFCSGTCPPGQGPAVVAPPPAWRGTMAKLIRKGTQASVKIPEKTLRGAPAALSRERQSRTAVLLSTIAKSRLSVPPK